MRKVISTVIFFLIVALAAHGQTTPSITRLSPTAGPPTPVGSTISITGTNFGSTQGSSAVTVGGVAVSPTSWTATRISGVPVPASLGSGFEDVVVTVNGVASGAKSFLIIPVITVLSPSTAAAGTTVTINGAGFGPSQGSSTVTLNNTPVTPTSWGVSSIQVSVPSGATTSTLVVTVNGWASNGVTLTVPGPPPVINSISPTSGTVGTSLTISGSNFGATQGSSQVSVGTAAAIASVSSWSDSSITVSIPNSAVSGPVFVIVAGQASNGAITVPPNITGVSPASGPTGTTFTITGTNFGSTSVNGANKVTLSGTVLSPSSWSTTSIQASIPSGASGGALGVTVNGVASNSVTFNVALLNVSGISPITGPPGTSVHITGVGFGGVQGNSVVTFNGAAATPTSWSDTGITVLIPGGTLPGTGNMLVTVGGVASNGAAFTVTPTVSSLSSATGVAGTAVTVSGGNFGTSQGTSTVSVGGNNVAPTSWSNGSIVIPVPNLVAGSANVVITVNGIPSIGTPFSIMPAITSLPTVAQVGDSITIAGTGFGSAQGTSTVSFNGVTATVTSWSSSSLAVTVPGGAASGNVVIAVNSLSSSGVPITISPVISTISPASGAVGTSVSVTGTGFGATQGTSAVTFNGTSATPLSWSPTQIVVLVPSGATGGNVVVTIGGTASNSVSFAVAPSISSLSPTSGAAGTSVVITGSNFGAAQGTSTVSFNGTVGTPTSWSNSQIIVPLPGGASTGNVAVTVNGLGSNSVSFAVTPSISSLSPTSGAAGTSVVITGSNFGAAQGTSTVSFNGTVGTPTSWSNSQIIVPLPGGASTGNVAVTVNGLGSNSVSFAVTPSISSLSPTSGAAGTSVVITGSNFGAAQGTSTVSFNGTVGTPTSWSNSQIIVPLPGGASTGNVAVTVNGLGSNGVSFAVAPSISGLSPTSGPAGTVVTIYGTGFGGVQGSSTLTFNGTLSSPTSWSDSQIIVPLPGAASTGNVAVTVNGLASNNVSFALAPGISSLSPGSGLVGTVVTITGSGFGGVQGSSLITFNGTAASPVSWSNTQIVVPVPSGASTGSVVIVVSGQVSSGVSFAVLPKITNVIPASGPIGTVVTITGNSFGSGSGIVTFNGTGAAPTSWTDTQIIVPVPSGANTGNVVVTAGGQVSSPASFTVLPKITNLPPGALPVVTVSGGATPDGDIPGSQPLSLAKEDFNQDGIEDVVVGYGTTSGSGILVLYPGNPDALSPQSPASWQALTQGQYLHPFLSTTEVFQTPKTVDFLASGRFAGTDHADLITAARNDNTLYLLAGNGHSQFAAPQAIALPAGVTFLAAGKYGKQSQFTSLLVGVGDSQHSSLLVFSGSRSGLSLVGTYPLPAPAAAITFGDLDGDLQSDAVILAGGQILILHAAPTVNPQLETLSLNLSAKSVIVGSFVHDRSWREQMAVLSADGSIYIVAPSCFDGRGWTKAEIQAMWDARAHRRPNPFAHSTAPLLGGWQVVEVFPAAAPFTSHVPWLYRARMSAQGAEDVMVMNPDATQTMLISHANVPAGASTFIPGRISLGTYSLGPLLAGLPMRVNADARPGVVVLTQGQAELSAMMPSPPPTFTVNTSNDTVDANPGDGTCADSTGHCSLRAAIMEANASVNNTNTNSPTILVPAGTYNLTIPSAGTFDASTGHLDINNGLSIVGAGSDKTIIHATNGDQIFSILDLAPINPDPSNQGPGIPVSISGVTLSGGNGATALLGGGGLAWDAGTDGSGSLNLSSVVISGNSSPSVGGGLALSNLSQSPDPGPNPNSSAVSISASTITANVATVAGGGISTNGLLAVSLLNTQVLTNQVIDPSAASQQQGGGIFFSTFLLPDGSAGPASQIHGGSISGNSAGAAGLGEGGGVWTNQALVIDRSTIISNNQTAGSGGGVWSGLVSSTDTMAIIGSSLIGNHADANGGGIQIDNTNAGSLSMSFNRIVNNTSGTGGNGLNNASTATVVADDNWWGCNAGPTVPSSGCDLVQGVQPASQITLAHSPNPASIVLGTSTQLTASFQDGNASFANNLDALVGVPVSFQNAVGGTLSNVQSTIQANGTATATFTATATGAGTVDALADHQTVTASIAVQDFNLSATPASQSVTAGGSSSVVYTAKVTPFSGFTGTVAVTCTAASGITIAPPCPASVSVSGGQPVSFPVSAAAAPSTTPGSYSIKVAGTSQGAERDTTVTLDVADFTVTPAQTTLTVNVGTASNPSPTDAVTVASLGGFSGTVSLTCSAPANSGVHANCAPSALALGSNSTAVSTLTVSTDASAAAGSYPITINASAAGVTRTATVNLVVADFSVSISPPQQTINATTSTPYSVTVSTTTGFNGTVSISCSAPAGSGITFNPACPSSVALSPLAGSTNASTSFTLTANTTSATAGSNTLTVAGTSGIAQRPGSAQLVAANFTLTPNVTTQTVNVGTASTSNYIISAAPVSGYSGTVNLTATVSPSVANGPQVGFVPASISSSGSSTMSVSTFASAAGFTPSGTYTVTVTGTSGGITQTTTVVLVVADFSLAGVPNSITADAGATSPSVTITGSPVNGFNGTVSFTPTNVAGLPPGATVAFTSQQIIVAAGSTTNATGMTVTTLGSTAPASYGLTVSGVSGFATHSVPVTLNIPGFSLGVAAPGSSQTATAGGPTATFNLFGQSLAGFSGTVNLSATISSGGPGVSLSQPSISLTPNGTGQSAFTVSVPAPDTTPGGTYTITVTATSGSITKTVTLTLVLNPSPPTFDMIVAPLSQTNFTYAASTFYIFLPAVSGFNTPVTVSVSQASGPSLPSNALFGFCTNCAGSNIVPNYVTTTTVPILNNGIGLMGETQMVLCPAAAPGPTIPVGTYTFNLTATAGGITRTATLTLIITLAPSFTMSTTPGPLTVVKITQGGSATWTVTLSDFVNIPAGTVFQLSSFGTPTGATATFNPPSLSAPGTSTLTVQTTAATPPDLYTFQIVASGGAPDLTEAVQAALGVAAPPPAFSFSVGAPQIAPPGQTASFDYAISNFANNFNSAVSITVAGLPAGATGTLTPGSFSAPGAGTLSVSISSSTPTGTYPLTFTASGGGVSFTATTSLTVGDPPPPPPPPGGCGNPPCPIDNN